MTDTFIHDAEQPHGRPATEEEIADRLVAASTATEVLDLLASLNAADGTNDLDIYNQTRDQD